MQNFLAIAIAAGALCIGNQATGAETPLEFNRDVRPILSENCFFCHGQDPKHREAKLRLDLPEEASRDLGGYAAIVPGKPEASELVERINSHDPDDLMPPKKSNRHLSPEQKETLRRWVREGAVYQPHWAFIAPVRAPLPAVTNGAWPRNEIDRFILARLEKEGLAPSKETAPETWLRRVSFDLVGLPPSPPEIDAFLTGVATRGEAEYSAAVDRMLASEHFGERMAIDWLDVSRYADTHGFNNDSARTMWRWRDWVINSFNRGLPYDQFITEQLAGDLLPGANLDQQLATGFCRNHVINSEGGIIEEEYRVEYVADRVRTMSMAWMGLTLECARCHDHKFDPLTQRDYYRLFGFFNQNAENGEDGRVANAVPILPAPTPAQSEELAASGRELAQLDGKLQSARKAWQWQPEQRELILRRAEKAKTAAAVPEASLRLDCETADPLKDALSFPAAPPSFGDGVTGRSWKASGVEALARIEPNALKFEAPAGVTVSLWIRPSESNPADVALFSNEDYGGSPEGDGYGKGQELRLVGGELDFRLNQRFPSYAVRVVTEGAALQSGEWRHVALAYGGGGKAAGVRLFVDGREVSTRTIRDGFPTDATPRSAPYFLGADAAKGAAKFTGDVDEIGLYRRALSGEEIRSVYLAVALPAALVKVDGGGGSDRESAVVRDAVLEESDAGWEAARGERQSVWEKQLAARRGFPTSMVMSDLAEPRQTFILQRGQYDAHGEAVEPGVPERLLAPWPAGAPRNRLGLAQWLTQPSHPLTARVVVNRFWSQLFGTGLVKTLGDFGAQGEWPSHPELLDWLARDFIDGGWNVKRLLKTIVLSAAYRQNSAATPDLLVKDPENRLLARGPRVRLPAELIRDQALAISGLLRHRVGGPSVFPYQPETLYSGIVVGANYPGTRWETSKGDDLYRRSLYTFWKRTIPYPVMLTFDAPDREFCSVSRSRTNTPLQALTLLNEPGFLEAARRLGDRMLLEAPPNDEARVAFAFRLATSRLPTRPESGVLTRALQSFRKEYEADLKGAEGMLKAGASAREASLSPAEEAAAATVASMILNLDETITKN